MKLSFRGQAPKGWDHFHGGRWTLKKPCKDFNLAIGGGLGRMERLKNGAGKSLYLSNYFCTISSLEKILLINLKYLHIQYAWMSIMKSQNINQNGKVENIVVLVKTFDHYHHKFQIFQLSCKIIKEFELYNFKIKRAQEARHKHFFFQNVPNNEIFEIFKMFQNNSWINVYYTKSKRL